MQATLFILSSLSCALTAKEPPSLEEVLRCFDNCVEAYYRCKACPGLGRYKIRGVECYYIRRLCIEDCDDYTELWGTY